MHALPRRVSDLEAIEKVIEHLQAFCDEDLVEQDEQGNGDTSIEHEKEETLSECVEIHQIIKAVAGACFWCEAPLPKGCLSFSLGRAERFCSEICGSNWMLDVSKSPEQRRCINPDCTFRQHPNKVTRGFGYCCKQCNKHHDSGPDKKPKNQHGRLCRGEEAESIHEDTAVDEDELSEPQATAEGEDHAEQGGIGPSQRKIPRTSSWEPPWRAKKVGKAAEKRTN